MTLAAQRLVDLRWPVSLAFAALLFGIWEAVALLAGVPPYVLAPSRIVTAFFDQLGHGDLLSATGATLQRMLPGFAIGTTLGVALGLLAGVARWAEDFFDSLVSFTYPLPKISLFPIFVVAFGFSDSARILTIGLSVFYPAFVNSLAGTRAVDPRLVWTARNFEAGRSETFLRVIARSALPLVLVGVRISLALSFVLTFATETIGAGRDGLGVVIQDGYNTLQYEPMYAGIAMFAVLGFLADVALRLVAGRVLAGQRLETGRG